LKVAIGSDHAGYELKKHLYEMLNREGHEVIDCGTDSESRTDYPDYAIEVGKKVAGRDAERGILVCGTGIGMSIAANKVPGIRAALCANERCAEMSRRHNNANVLTLGGRELAAEAAEKIVRVWMSTPFEGGRHAGRLARIAEYEERRDGRK